MIDIDRVDKAILGGLLLNARTPLTKLARKARVSREVAGYRLSRMQQKGIILKYITRINIAALGFMEAAVFLNVQASHAAEFKKYIRGSPFLSWVSVHTGVWNFGFGIAGRSIEDITKRFDELHKQFGECIISHRLSFIKRTHFFWENCVGGEHIAARRSIAHVKPDDLDLKILKELSMNARIEYAELSSICNLTAPAIKRRIDLLKETGVIEQYSVFMDLSRLGLLQFSVFVTNQDHQELLRLSKHLQQHKDVVFVVEYVGDEFLEFGVVLGSPFALRAILQEVQESFPGTRIKEFSLVQEDIVSTGPPSCVFDH